MIKINEFLDFYGLSKNWKTQSCEKKYFENNLFLALFQMVEGYINFKILKLQQCERLSDFEF